MKFQQHGINIGAQYYEIDEKHLMFATLSSSFNALFCVLKNNFEAVQKCANLVESRFRLGEGHTFAIRGVDVAENEPPKAPTRKHKSLIGNTDNFLRPFTRNSDLWNFSLLPSENRRTFTGIPH